MALTYGLDKTFDELEGWQARLVLEHNYLYDKFISLTRFIESDEINSVKMDERVDLRIQREIMANYLSILNSRIARFA